MLCEVPKSHPTHAGFRVCEKCLKAGDVQQQMLDHADELEQRAKYLRDTASRLQVPTYAEWQYADRVADAVQVLYHTTDFEVPTNEVLAWPREQQLEIIARAEAVLVREAAEREAASRLVSGDSDDIPF